MATFRRGDCVRLVARRFPEHYTSEPAGFGDIGDTGIVVGFWGDAEEEIGIKWDKGPAPGLWGITTCRAYMLAPATDNSEWADQQIQKLLDVCKTEKLPLDVTAFGD